LNHILILGVDRPAIEKYRQMLEGYDYGVYAVAFSADSSLHITHIDQLKYRNGLIGHSPSL